MLKATTAVAAKPLAVTVAALALCSAPPAFAQQPAPPSAPPGAQPPATPTAAAEPPRAGPPRQAPPRVSPPPPGYGAPPPGYGAPPPGYYPYYPPPYGYGYPPPPPPADASPSTAETPPTTTLKFDRRSPGMLTGGIVLTTIGGVGMAVAGVLASTAAVCSDCSSSSQDGKAVAALTMLILGGICVGIGVPMIVSGGHRVPKVTHEHEGQEPQALRWIGAPGGRGWIWTF